jgi:hypothetical protein
VKESAHSSGGIHCWVTIRYRMDGLLAFDTVEGQAGGFMVRQIDEY